MKIIFTGGGTGGHFYPIIAVAQEIQDVLREQKMVDPKMYFMAPKPYNSGLLYDYNIEFRKVSAGKVRRYKSILNFFDLFKTAFGVLGALWTVFWIYPDVVFSKGGYGSFPVTTAARILGIPVMIHESDSEFGKANAYAAKFAAKIGVSYPDAAKGIDPSKVAWTGTPVRKDIAQKATEGAHSFLELDPNIKTILILGGSQGSQFINDTVLDALERLVAKYQVVHQTGKKNFKVVSDTSQLILNLSTDANRYKPFAYMNDLAMRMSAGAADLVITRAGSALFEIAQWGIPSIIIPIPEAVSHDQRQNAYNYARSGAGIVIEENNAGPDLLLAEIERILQNDKIQSDMTTAALAFAKPDAARRIAEELLEIGISHE